jgi:hypothetical protein
MYDAHSREQYKVLHTPTYDTLSLSYAMIGWTHGEAKKYLYLVPPIPPYITILQPLGHPRKSYILTAKKAPLAGVSSNVRDVEAAPPHLI